MFSIHHILDASTAKETKRPSFECIKTDSSIGIAKINHKKHMLVSSKSPQAAAIANAIPNGKCIEKGQMVRGVLNPIK